MVLVSLATGQSVWTAALSGSLTSAYLAGAVQNLGGLMYKSLIVTYLPQASTAGQPWTGMEGLDPRSGRARWTGPWMSSEMEVLGWTTTGPPELIVETCAPVGTQNENATCTAARIFALNA
jgi:hypothetical protein